MTGFRATPLKGVARILAVSIAMLGVPFHAIAQSAQTDVAALPPQDQAASIAQIIEANQAQGVEALTQALAPLIIADPGLAATVVEIAKNKPELAEMLAEVLARIQATLKTLDPEKAQQLAGIVATAPPAFQAAYAVALAPDDGGGSADQAAARSPTRVAAAAVAGARHTTPAAEAARAVSGAAP